MPDLFALEDLPSYLQIPEVDTETATRMRRYASGWLADATGLTAWPDPIPDRLWAWAIELAAIAYRNPAGAASLAIDDFNFTADASRREQILARAKAAYPDSAGGSPRYSFPTWDWSWTTADASVVTSE